jgi:hypothetical protein
VSFFGVAVGVGVGGCTIATTGTRARLAVVAGLVGTAGGSREGVGVGSIVGLGSALGNVVGSADGPGGLGLTVGRG